MENDKLEFIKLTDINFEDESQRFREDLDIENLKDSIESDGLTVPVTLCQLEDGRYQIISGFRRLTALQELQHSVVPAFIRDLPEYTDKFVASITENVVRKDLKFSDMMNAIVQARKNGVSQKDIAEVLGWSTRHVRRHETLAKLTKKVIEAIDDTFTPKHAMKLISLQDAGHKIDFPGWAKKVKEGKLSVKSLEEAIIGADKPEKVIYEKTDKEIIIKGTRLQLEKITNEKIDAKLKQLKALMDELEGLKKG